MNNWIYKVFLLTFLLSVLFSTITNLIAYNTNQILIFIIIVVIIIVGIIFDMIATACLTSNEASFHAMNSKKIKGAKEAISLVKNSVQVANLCADVIGDICGIISGGLGAVFAINIAATTDFNVAMSSVIVGAFISSFMVGGKAIFKEVAIKNSDNIIFIIGKIKHFFKLK